MCGSEYSLYPPKHILICQADELQHCYQAGRIGRTFDLPSLQFYPGNRYNAFPAPREPEGKVPQPRPQKYTPNSRPPHNHPILRQHPHLETLTSSSPTPSDMSMIAQPSDSRSPSPSQYIYAVYQHNISFPRANAPDNQIRRVGQSGRRPRARLSIPVRFHSKGRDDSNESGSQQGIRRLLLLSWRT